MLAPLSVRELDGNSNEVAAGARRVRAAKLAELKTVPIRVVKLTDAEAIEAPVVELSVVGKIFLCGCAMRHVVYIKRPEGSTPSIPLVSPLPHGP